jgi:hypothetical protein
MTIDFTKPVTTRDGCPVRILCTDRPGEFPVVGLVGEDVYAWTLDGGFGYGRNSPYDLSNPKTKREAWTLVYKDTGNVLFSRSVGGLFTTEVAAEEYVKGGRGAFIAVARVEWEE